MDMKSVYIVVGLIAIVAVVAIILVVVSVVPISSVFAEQYKDEISGYISEEAYEDRVLTCSMIQQQGENYEGIADISPDVDCADYVLTEQDVKDIVKWVMFDRN